MILGGITTSYCLPVTKKGEFPTPSTFHERIILILYAFLLDLKTSGFFVTEAQLDNKRRHKYKCSVLNIHLHRGICCIIFKLKEMFSVSSKFRLRTTLLVYSDYWNLFLLIRLYMWNEKFSRVWWIRKDVKGNVPDLFFWSMRVQTHLCIDKGKCQNLLFGFTMQHEIFHRATLSLMTFAKR
jgi:hypothetical protein